MDDRKLLERAAEAAGVEIATWSNCQAGGFVKDQSGVFWNPLENDGDALRLAVSLRIRFERHARFEFVAAFAPEVVGRFEEPEGNDACAATRRAIVRAAASLTPNVEVKGGRDE